MAIDSSNRIKAYKKKMMSVDSHQNISNFGTIKPRVNRSLMHCEYNKKHNKNARGQRTRFEPGMLQRYKSINDAIANGECTGQNDWMNDMFPPDNRPLHSSREKWVTMSLEEKRNHMLSKADAAGKNSIEYEHIHNLWGHSKVRNKIKKVNQARARSLAKRYK